MKLGLAFEVVPSEETRLLTKKKSSEARLRLGLDHVNGFRRDGVGQECR